MTDVSPEVKLTLEVIKGCDVAPSGLVKVAVHRQQQVRVSELYSYAIGAGGVAWVWVRCGKPSVSLKTAMVVGLGNDGRGFLPLFNSHTALSAAITPSSSGLSTVPPMLQHHGEQRK